MAGKVVEAEPGNETQFCPIRGLPIVRSQRVRTLPGYHLLSLDAGRQALALGSYQAFGETFACNDLHYLHPEDKVFICSEDHKAFLNQMSMQYHRYICHELGERKAERRRMRERAAERQARSAAHQQAQAERRGKKAKHDPYLADPPAGSHATVDPYLTDAGDAAAKDVPAVVPPVSSAPVASTVPLESKPSAKAVRSAATEVKKAAPVAASQASLKIPSDDEGGDDLYEDLDSRKQTKTTSSYATAVGAMLDGNFDDDD